jgi:hypothetical protein
MTGQRARTACVVAIGLSAAMFSPSAFSASCVPATEDQLQKRAQVIFKGRALPGPTVEGRDGGELLSPARFRILRYIKGRGPDLVTVPTATERDGGGYATSSGGIQPRPDERWRILGTWSNRHKTVLTDVCSGSVRRRPASG